MFCIGHAGLHAQEQTAIQDTVVVFGIPMVIKRDTVNYWKTDANINLNIQQIGLVNWTAGGESSLGIGTIIEGDANYEKDDVVWQNRGRVAYGILRQGDRTNKFRKTDDNLLLSSKYSQKFSEQVLMTSQILFQTQMDEGYKLETLPGASSPTQVLISNFMSPGYMQASLGLTFRNAEKFDVTLSPFTGRFTFVLNDSLSNQGSFGVEPGQMVRSEAGISMTGSVKTKIIENVDFRLSANLFSNYERFPATVLNALLQLDLRVNEFIGAKISSQFIYDEDVLVTFSDGTQGTGLQSKNVINVGFNLKF